MTEQSHYLNCDLHVIMNRYAKTGELPSGMHRGEGQYMDAPDQEQDYQHMQNKLAELRSMYYELPLPVQQQYGDPLDYARAVLSQLEAQQGQDQPEEETSPPADTEAPAEGAEGTSEASQSS